MVIQCNQCTREELMEILGLPVEDTEERALATMVVIEYFELRRDDNEATAMQGLR